MREFPYLQLDVFADRPGAGNPLAVVLDADVLDDVEMQAIARWTRLPETTFVLRPRVPEADYRLRIFSPRREVPFAGHPSIGTAHAVLEANPSLAGRKELIQECAVGLLPLAISQCENARHIAVRAPAARVLEIASPATELLIAALNDALLGQLPPALMDGGRRWWLVELESENALRNFSTSWPAISALASAYDAMGLCLFARSHEPGIDFVVRALVGQPAQFEDAASGAANATLAAWLHYNNALPHEHGRYVVSQGREVGHDARLHLRVDSDSHVWSGGQIQTVVRGRINWP